MAAGNKVSLFPLTKDKIFYGWVIVAVSFVITCVLAGIRNSFGVSFKPLEAEFELTRAATSSIFSIYMLLLAISTFITGWALDRYGPKLVVFLMGLFTGLSLVVTSQTNSFWQIFITYSLLLSIGTGGSRPMLLWVISRWFSKKRGFALGIATSGIGLGTIVIAPFAAYLISILDWRMAYVVLGFITLLVVIPLAMLLLRDPGEIGALPDGVKSSIGRTELASNPDSYQQAGISPPQALRMRSFWLLLVTFFLVASGMSLIITHVVPYATDTGISPIEASTILSLMGGFHILSRLLTGRISDMIGRKIPVIICAILGSVALIWLIWSRDLWMFYLFAVLFGLAWGGIGVNIIALTGDIFGGRSLGTIFGIVEAGAALGQAFGATLGGFIFDVTGSYVIAFITAAVAFLIVTITVSQARHEVKI